jgi:hypothetical protein
MLPRRPAKRASEFSTMVLRSEGWGARGELGERGELVYERAHGFDRGGDDFGGALDDGGGGRVDAVLGE